MTIETEMTLNTDSSDGVSLIAAGRLFHARDAATGNDSEMNNGQWNETKHNYNNSITKTNWFIIDSVLHYLHCIKQKINIKKEHNSLKQIYSLITLYV